MTMKGDDAVLTSYNQRLEENLKKKHSHTSYLHAATMSRNVYWLPVPTVLATGEMTSNLFMGEGVALMLFLGSSLGLPEQAERKGAGK